MADETPEQIRERVLAEELAKGSDPRVAEGRAKAAEMRTRHGLPIDPDQAWRALLEREGGTPAAATAEAEPAAPAAEPAAPAEPAAEQPEPAAVEEAEPAQAPAAEPAAEAAPPPAAAAAAQEPAAATPEAEPAAQRPPAAPAPVREPEHEPEIGDLLDVDAEAPESFAGIKVRESRLPAGLLLVLVMIPLWAIFYLAAFAGSDSIARTTGCSVEPDHTLVCFQESKVGE